MLTYLKRLVDERDSLTATATGMTDTAARENRDLNETEEASLATMQQRCAAIDTQLETYNGQADSARAYATLRGRLTAADGGAGDPDDAGGTGGGGFDTRDGGRRIETAEWAEPFERSGVLDRYDGHGRSETVWLDGSVLETRGYTETEDLYIVPQRITRPEPTFRFTLLDVVDVTPTTAGAVEWLRTGPNPAPDAAEVPEGELKPEMQIELELIEQRLKTYAHYKGMSRQALEDVPQIRSVIEGRLRAGLQAKVNRGVGEVIAADPDIPEIAAEDLLSGVRLALADFDDDSGYVPNAVGLNPTDWAEIDLALLLRTLNGANVNSATWGLRLFASSRFAPGTAYVGDFKTAVTVFDRRKTGVYMTDSHAEDFLRNRLVILAETRALPCVPEPLALRKVHAAAAAPDAAPAAPAAPVPPTPPAGS